MALSIGIIGMPNVGKSTLLNALTHAHADASNYPFCTTEQNVGVAEVPDERLGRLNELLNPEACTPTTVQFTDIAGLVQGASRGEGLGNRFLGHIRTVDAMLHVVRCFHDERIVHVDGTVDPVRDLEIVDTELTLADLESAENGIDTQTRLVRSGVKGSKERLDVLTTIREGLSEGKAIRALGLPADRMSYVRDFNFLTTKPVLYVANVDENDVHGESEDAQRLRRAVGEDRLIPISVEIEEEISELEGEEEQQAFLEDIGLKETGLRRLVLASYRLLHLITFYTIAHNKLRAWQAVEGSTAEEAAGKIHSDMEQGFIRAEVMSYEDVATYRTMAELHRHGRVRAEGREYAMKDGDVVHVLFHV